MHYFQIIDNENKDLKYISNIYSVRSVMVFFGHISV